MSQKIVLPTDTIKVAFEKCNDNYTELYNALILSQGVWVIPVTGRSSGTPTNGTIVFSATEDLFITKTGDVTINITRGSDGTHRQHTIVVSCPNGGSGTIEIVGRDKIKSLGNYNGTSLPNVNFYSGVDATMPILTIQIGSIPANIEKVTSTAILVTSLNITGVGGWPSGLKVLNVYGGSWEYSGSMPSSLEYLYLVGNSIKYTYNGSFPQALTFVQINGMSINWTGLNVGEANLTTLTLTNYRNAKMSSADMLTFLNHLTTRTGTLPSTITINDYADYASPPQSVIDAVALLKSTKSITTVNLGA